MAVTKKINTENLEDRIFELPIGFTDDNGVTHKQIQLKPMTGEVDEMIADPKVRDNLGKITTAVIYGVTEKLGTLTKFNKDNIRRLTTVDRNFILAMNRLVSFGDEVTFVSRCPHCGGMNDVSINITDLEVKYPSDDFTGEITFELPVGVKDKDGNIHKTITLTLPNGVTEERIAPLLRVNPAQAQTALLQAVTKSLGTMSVLSSDVFRQMTKKDRDFIVKKLSELNYGIQNQFMAVCSVCGEEFEASIPFEAFMGE